jgi:hypothetical protein
LKHKSIGLSPILLFCLLLPIYLTAKAEMSPSSKIPISRPDPDGQPTRVEVGIWVVDINSIDSVAQSFKANIFIVLKWTDARLSHEGKAAKRLPLDEIWSPNVLIANEFGIVRTSYPPTVQIEADGTVTYRQRHQGSFTQPLKLNNFPFDRHTFSIQLVAQNSITEEIDLVPYLQFAQYGMKDSAGIANNISLPDWSIENYAAGPAPYELTPTLQAAGYQLVFEAERNAGHYIWKVILPLVLIVCMSWIVFWIDPSRFEAQISLATTSMLTLIAYRFTSDAIVPMVEYMTRLDGFILSGSVLVFLTLIQASLTGHLHALYKTDMAIKIDIWCRFLFPLIFIIASLLTLVW